MKLTSGKLISEIKKIERLLVRNFDADESDSFSSMLVQIQKQVPKGVNEKLSFLANLYERALKGEKIDSADLKQAGFWIDAVWPFVSNGAPRVSRLGSRLAWVVVAIIVAALAYHFLH